MTASSQAREPRRNAAPKPRRNRKRRFDRPGRAPDAKLAQAPQAAPHRDDIAEPWVRAESGDRRAEPVGRLSKAEIAASGFTALGLEPALVAALARAGLANPKPIQKMAIPAQLEGADILGLAQTGSGKTAAFGLPIVQGVAAMRGAPAGRTTRALILAPTRELAAQIEDNLLKFAAGSRLTTALVLGGASRGAQISKLRRGVDIVIATPGRLLDLIEERHLSLDMTRWLVLDEADRMLDMGFIEPVRRIAALMPKDRRTALFSATMPKAVEALAASLLKNPVRVEADRVNSQPVVIAQSVMVVAAGEKRARLADILSRPDVSRTLVFARTKHGADRVVKDLARDGLRAEAIHGNKNQNARQRALNAFREGTLKILVATDIAARGIDVPGISHVVNYDLPDEPENYVHRIGRTGRNGAQGVAITLCDHAERGKLRAVERAAGLRFALDAPFDESVPLMERGKNRGKSKPRDSAARPPRRKKPSTHRKGPSPKAAQEFRRRHEG